MEEEASGREQDKCRGGSGSGTTSLGGTVSALHDQNGHAVAVVQKSIVVSSQGVEHTTVCLAT